MAKVKLASKALASRGAKIKSKTARNLIVAHLKGMSRSLLEGKYGDSVRLKLGCKGQGLYVLYKPSGEIYYVGRGKDVGARLEDHRSNLHADNWQKMACFIFKPSVNVEELERLVIAITDPPGNKQKGRLTGDLKSEIAREVLGQQRKEFQIGFGDGKWQAEIEDKRYRLTVKKLRFWLKKVGNRKASTTLGISPNYLSNRRQDLKEFHKWVIQSGRRDTVLVALQSLNSVVN
jgi:hypothetical protein